MDIGIGTLNGFILNRHAKYVENGSDLLAIKEVLRHMCIDSTMRYTHLSNEAKRVKHDRFSRL